MQPPLSLDIQAAGARSTISSIYASVASQPAVRHKNETHSRIRLRSHYDLQFHCQRQLLTQIRLGTTRTWNLSKTVPASHHSNREELPPHSDNCSFYKIHRPTRRAIKGPCRFHDWIDSCSLRQPNKHTSSGKGLIQPTSKIHCNSQGQF